MRVDNQGTSDDDHNRRLLVPVLPGRAMAIKYLIAFAVDGMRGS